MLRDVNKKIIEINDTENRYFEKAVLYVRQGDWAPREIEERAADFIHSITEQVGGMPSAAPSATATKVRWTVGRLLKRAGVVLGVLALVGLILLL